MTKSVKKPWEMRNVKTYRKFDTKTIKPIRTDADYNATLARIDELMDAQPDSPEGEELDVLADLVEIYEARHMPMD